MRYIKSFFTWVTESTARTITGLVVLYFFVFCVVSLASANSRLTTSWDVTNNPQMRLGTTITPTQTTGITIFPLTKNGDTVTFPNLSGGMLRIRNGSDFEDLSFTGATVNASTKEVTLYGVTRDICWNQPNLLVGCGNGEQWFNGDIVELNIDARLLNWKLNIDRVNILTGSGRITGTSTGQSILDLPCVTTTQRDAFSGVSDGQLICNSTLGTLQYRSGGAWISFGSGSTVNASDTTAGKVQIIPYSDLINRTATGSTGAQNVLSPRWVIKNGSGSVSASLIPQLNQVGVLSPTLGGTGSGGQLGVASGAILVAQGKNAFRPIYASTTTGSVLKSNGKVWTTGTVGDNRKIVVMARDFMNMTTANFTGAALKQFNNGGGNGPARLEEFAFNPTLQKEAFTNLRLPDDYTGGTVTVSFIWDSTNAGTPTQGIVWDASAMSFADNESYLTVGYGTPQSVSDVMDTQTSIFISGATPAITIGGTPAAGEFASFRFRRITGNASDTLTTSGGLLGVIINY